MSEWTDEYKKSCTICGEEMCHPTKTVCLSCEAGIPIKRREMSNPDRKEGYE